MVYYAYFGISAVGIGLSDECCMSTFEFKFHFTSPSVGDDLAVFSFQSVGSVIFSEVKYFFLLLRLSTGRKVCMSQACQYSGNGYFRPFHLLEASTYRWQQMLGGDMDQRSPMNIGMVSFHVLGEIESACEL